MIQQITIFDVIRHMDMPHIQVGDICKLKPLAENQEYYADHFPQMLGKEVKVERIENQNANTLKMGAWIRHKDILTVAYFDDLEPVRGVR